MSDSLPRDLPTRLRIVDVVFAAARPERRWLPWLAMLLAAALHGSLFFWAQSSRKSLESWSAELAVRVHAELSHEEMVELARPTEPPPPATPEPEVAPAPRAPAHAPREHAAQPAQPPPPAQAGTIVAANPDAPVDLTSSPFVTGTANAYAGGVTTAAGTSQIAVHTVEVAAATARMRPGRAAPAPPDESSRVELQEQDWKCAWPSEAQDEAIDEEVVVLRVVVRADGSAESARVITDPGKGFGAAALACALRTRFVSARDARGRPILAPSPPIRVRFTR